MRRTQAKIKIQRDRTAQIKRTQTTGNRQKGHKVNGTDRQNDTDKEGGTDRETCER